MKTSEHKDNKGNSTETDGKFAMYRTFLEEGEMSRFYAIESENPLTGAFDKKVSVHAGLSGSRVPQELTADFYSRLSGTQRRGKTSAYIHVPFCENHCLYCGFFSNRYEDAPASEYVDSLVAELRNSSDDAVVGKSPVHSVYIGGGTPSALSAKDLKRLLSAISEYLPLSNDCEITVEGRIHSFDDEKIDACIEGGANRFSIGVQTFNTELRQSMKRFATQKEAASFIQKLADTDQAAVVIDLIYGFPNQTMDMWEDDLKFATSLPLDGLDLYQLNVFRTSPLHKAIEKGHFPQAPGIHGQALMFERGVRFMEGERWRRLSVSHWARTPRERNLYNLMMKSRNTCLQYGAGAGGCISDHMVFNESSLEKYTSVVASARKPVAAVICPPENPALVSSITGELEQLRLNVRRLGERAGADLESLYSGLLQQWSRAGLVRMDNGWIEPTLAGQFWEVNLAQALIDFYNQTAEKNSGGANETLAVNA